MRTCHRKKPMLPLLLNLVLLCTKIDSTRKQHLRNAGSVRNIPIRNGWLIQNVSHLSGKRPNLPRHTVKESVNFFEWIFPFNINLLPCFIVILSNDGNIFTKHQSTTASLPFSRHFWSELKRFRWPMMTTVALKAASRNLLRDRSQADTAITQIKSRATEQDQGQERH